MPLTPDQVFDAACDALRKMLSDNGASFTFPFDLIWMNTPPGLDIPSSSRPSQRNRLLKAGFIEKTGEMRPAASEKRASSLGPEFRFGPALVPPLVVPITTGAPPAAAGPATADELARLQAAMDADGYAISTAELTNFFLAMLASPLVILSGISGSGKSLLPRKFAHHTGAAFHAVPVQPQWSDNSDLFGYVPTLTPDQYVEGRLIPSLRDALANKSRLVVVLLDELNLAPVEHYFSDFLSVVETRRRQAGMVVTDLLPITLPSASPGIPDALSDLRSASLPNNLRVVGTANMDETTRSFSPKVLDRAFTIEFDDPDLTMFASGASGAPASLTALAALIANEGNPISVLEARSTSQDLFDDVSALLKEVADILAPAGIKFGYRTRDAVLLYLHHWRELALETVLTGNGALDFCLLQKVLPKVTGTGDALGTALDELAQWLGRDRKGSPSENAFGLNGPFARSLQKVERMKLLLESDGATHYWGV